MRRPLFIVCLCLVAATALWLPLSGFPEQSGGGDMSHLPIDGEYISVTGKVYQKDIGRDGSGSFRIKCEKQSVIVSAADSRQTFSLNKNLICEAADMSHIRIGSTVVVRGRFVQFQNATNPGEFDAKAYYAAQDICGKLTETAILEADLEYSAVKEGLFRLRYYFREQLYRVFPEKEAAILTAMLLGDKAQLDAEIKGLYMDNGIIHILSISGLHITMIGMGIYKLLRRLGVRVRGAAVIGGVILILYGIMTGMSVSAYRAIGMYLIRMLGIVVGRTYDMLTALGVVAVFLIGQNPADLTNAGFLLSFGSIMGIGLLYPALLGNVESEMLKPLQSILASGSITLFTLPIQLWFYYEVPTYSVLMNLLVLPFMSLVLCTGFIAMLVPGFGVVGTVTCLILQGYEGLCELFSKLPYHKWNPGKPDGWQIAGFYLFVGIVIWLGGKKTTVLSKNNMRYACKAVLLTAAVIILALPVERGNRVTFLDVGQGDGIVLETASGQVYLFDCGSSSRKNIGEYVLLPFLKSRGIGHIDGVFVSHGDSDHCNGIVELLELSEREDITVEHLVLPAIAQTEREKEFGELLRAAECANSGKGTKVIWMKEGDCISAKGVDFLCLHPPEGYESASGNEYSQCFYVELEGENGTKASVLFTGDVEGAGEQLLLQELKQRGVEAVMVLKVAHHGSGNATSEELLEQISPKLSVISCGEGNSYGHPHPETLERLKKGGSQIMTTPEYGAITIEIDTELRAYGFGK